MSPELGELRGGRGSDPPQRAHRHRRQPLRLERRADPEDAGPLDQAPVAHRGLDALERELREELVAPSPTPQRSPELVVDAPTQRRGRPQGSHLEAAQAAQVGEDLVQPERLVVGREVAHDVVEPSRVLLVAIETSGQDDQ